MIGVAGAVAHGGVWHGGVWHGGSWRGGYRAVLGVGHVLKYFASG